MLCNVFKTTAQSTFKINIPESKAPDNKPDRMFYVDSVYATFPDTASIGTVYRSMAGDFAPAYIKNGVSKGFFKSLITFYPQFLPTQKPVQVRIEHLSYTEDFAQGVDFTMQLTFLTPDSTGRYFPLYTAQLETEFTGFIGRGVRIQGGMQRAFEGLNDFLLDPQKPAFLNDFEQNMKKAALEMNLDSAHYNDLSIVDHPIITAAQKRPGVYVTINDILSNRPTLTGTLNIEYKNDIAILQRPTKRPARYSFFGFSDGENVYINSSQYGNARGRYMKIQQIGRYLIWRDSYLTYKEVQKSQLLGNFGLVGALVSATTNTYKDCIAIDPKTGSLFHVDAAKLRDLLKDNPDLLAEYDASDHPKKADTIWGFLVRYNQLPYTQEK